MKKMAFLLLPLLLACDTPESPVKGPPVEWNDVRSWKNLGTSWGLALDSRNRPIAIYDFAYPNARRRKHLGYLPQTIPDASAQLKQIKAQLIRHQARLNLKQNPAQISLQFPRRTLTPNWWHKHLKWKGNRPTHAPQRFNLDELDLMAMTKKREAMERARARLAYESFQSGWKWGFEVEPLRQFTYEQDSRGRYHLYWNPVATGMDRPVKMADFRDPASGLHDALARDLLEEAVEAVIDLINVPVAQALVALAVNRVFHYQRLTRQSHQAGLIEQLAHSEHQLPFAPLVQLQPIERILSAVYILFGQTSIGTVWKWWFNTPAGEWADLKAEWLAEASDSRRILRDDGHETRLLSQHFALSSHQQKQYLWALRDKPRQLFQYQDPKENGVSERLEFELFTMGFYFASYFVPVAGGLVRLGYSEFIEHPVTEDKIWEARFYSHLEERSNSGEDWSHEMSILPARAINPLGLATPERQALIAKRKRRVGLTTKIGSTPTLNIQ